MITHLIRDSKLISPSLLADAAKEFIKNVNILSAIEFLKRIKKKSSTRRATGWNFTRLNT
jgi:hypothetical protein